MKLNVWTTAAALAGVAAAACAESTLIIGVTAGRPVDSAALEDAFSGSAGAAGEPSAGIVIIGPAGAGPTSITSL